ETAPRAPVVARGIGDLGDHRVRAVAHHHVVVAVALELDHRERHVLQLLERRLGGRFAAVAAARRAEADERGDGVRLGYEADARSLRVGPGLDVPALGAARAAVLRVGTWAGARDGTPAA